MITSKSVVAPSLKAWARSIYRWLPTALPEAIVYTKEVVEDLFKQLDLNGDGKVTSDEFSKKEVDSAIAKADQSLSRLIQSSRLSHDVRWD